MFFYIFIKDAESRQLRISLIRGESLTPHIIDMRVLYFQYH
jgi:hypothetical protein